MFLVLDRPIRASISWTGYKQLRRGQQVCISLRYNIVILFHYMWHPSKSISTIFITQYFSFRSSLNPSWSSLLYRGVRIVLPIHALMLLALGISSIAEFDAVYSVACTVQNTVKHSFEPLLSWPNGPPPYWISR